MANYQAQTIAYPAPTARPYRRGAEVIPPHVVVLFGATGDLARRKLLPGLAHLDASALAPKVIVVGSSLEDLSDDEFRTFAHTAVNEYGKHRLTQEQWDAFAGNLRYVSSAAGPEALAEAVAAAEEQLGEGVRRLHYLSVPPRAALDVISMLDRAKLVERARVVMEKPFGTDLDSAVSLNDQVHQVFDETQIFRIDHFLGKEAAQNVLALRFANGLFEPIWNRNFIDHVQIDVPETLGLDRRADFYESTGAYKDMVVTHLFQVLAFVAMEPPTALDPALDQRGEEQGLPRAAAGAALARGARPVRRVPRPGGGGPGLGHRDLHRPALPAGQLALGRGAVLPAHRQAHGRGAADHLDRLQGGAALDVPAGLRGGPAGPDHLTFDLADESRVSLSYYGKRPGPGMKLDKLSMQFSTQETDRAGDVLEAYERLILDAMRGDHTLFTTADGIESLWERSIPLMENPPPVKPYAPGSWGPNAIHQLITPHAWRLPFERSWREKKHPRGPPRGPSTRRCSAMLVTRGVFSAQARLIQPLRTIECAAGERVAGRAAGDGAVGDPEAAAVAEAVDRAGGDGAHRAALVRAGAVEAEEDPGLRLGDDHAGLRRRSRRRPPGWRPCWSPGSLGVLSATGERRPCGVGAATRRPGSE